MSFNVLPPPVAPQVNVSGLVSSADLAAAIAATEAKIEETGAIPVAWKQTLDIPTVMPKDGVYRFIVSGLAPGVNDAWWGVSNAPDGSTVTKDGEATQWGGTNRSLTIWGGSDVTIYREGNDFSILSDGARYFQNLRFSDNTTASGALSGSGELLYGGRPSRWMARNDGSIMWLQASATTTFQSILNVWNNTVHPTKAEYQIAELKYNDAIATLTNTLPSGLTVASWRNGVLSLRSL